MLFHNIQLLYNRHPTMYPVRRHTGSPRNLRANFVQIGPGFAAF